MLKIHGDDDIKLNENERTLQCHDECCKMSINVNVYVYKCICICICI